MVSHFVSLKRAALVFGLTWCPVHRVELGWVLSVSNPWWLLFHLRSTFCRYPVINRVVVFENEGLSLFPYPLRDVSVMWNLRGVKVDK